MRKQNTKVAIAVKGNFGHGMERSFGQMQAFDKRFKNRKACFNILLDNIRIGDGNYLGQDILSIWLSYKILDEVESKSIKNRVRNKTNNSVKKTAYPLTMDITTWGEKDSKIKYLSNNSAYFNKNGLMHLFEISDTAINITIEEIISGNTVTKFKDFIEEGLTYAQCDLTTFTRVMYKLVNNEWVENEIYKFELGRQTYHYLHLIIIL